MGNGGGWDSARWVAGIAGAFFQVGATILAGVAISEVVSEGPTSPVEPAGYAFGVWAVIFFFSLLFAVYQALPANRENTILRRVGWPVAVAFLCTGLWSVSVPLRQFGFAQVMLLGIFASLLVAYLRLSRSDSGALGRADRWFVSLAIGPFLGWVTAANAVSLTAEAVRRGLVDAGGAGEAAFGSVLLLLGALLACVVILAGRKGPLQGYLAYGATVLWALTGIVVNQYAFSLMTTVAASFGAVVVAFVLFAALRVGRPGDSGRRTTRPGMV